MSSPAVVIMCKAPRAGESKTRLAPLVSGEGAAALAGRFFADAAASLGRVAAALFVAYAPADGRAALEEALRGRADGPGPRWLRQRGRDLGERLAAVVEEVFGLGCGPVAVVGADSPTLPPAYVARALDALARGEWDAALGPTDDGGYYLVALNRPAPELFRGVEWSTPRAYAQTATNAARLGLRLLELPRWYDVDTPADLRRLRAELAADPAARLRAPATHEWLNEVA
jgi:rSAM/selenodomain-associated transferase 1